MHKDSSGEITFTLVFCLPSLDILQDFIGFFYFLGDTSGFWQLVRNLVYTHLCTRPFIFSLQLPFLCFSLPSFLISFLLSSILQYDFWFVLPTFLLAVFVACICAMVEFRAMWFES